MIQLHYIPVGNLYLVVPGLVPYLEKSEFWTNGRALIDDIIGFLYSGRMHLWIVSEQGNPTPKGYVVTEMKEYPRSKMLVVQYCAGDKHILEEVAEPTFEMLEKVARDAGCDGIEFFGRPGWTPHVKKLGYKPSTIVYEKYFGEV